MADVIAYGANIKHLPLMSTQSVRHDLEMARYHMERSAGGLGAFCEMASWGRNYDKIVPHVFHPSRYTVIGEHTEISLVIDHSEFRIHRHETIKLTKGSSRLPQPDRWLAMALVEPKWRKDIKPFWWAGTHLTNGAYTGGPHKPFKKRRRELWDAQHDGISQVFLSKEESILWTGDVNRRNMPRTLHEERVVVEHGIDTMRKIEKPGGTRFILDNGRALHGQRSDHRPIFARLNLEK